MLHKLYKNMFFSTIYKYNGNDRINLKNRRGKTNLKIILIKMKKKYDFQHVQFTWLLKYVMNKTNLCNVFTYRKYYS